jgi:ABC-type transporter Mla maintaining outer membrane lipid asymmetry ATPase subunit MlaF
MTSAVPPVLDVRAVTKAYGGLRPLRLASLTIGPGERVTIGGIEAGVSELLVNLVTGASLPDTGEVRVFGRPTADIADGDEWLDSLDRFGIVSPRGVLLEGATLLQNLAMPFTLAIDPVPDAVVQDVLRLSERCGIDARQWLQTTTSDLPADVRVRTHLARALALGPELLVVEHPTAEVVPAARRALAGDIVRACEPARVAVLVLTNDDEFATAVAPRNLTLHGATGALKPIARGWFTW